MRKARAVAVAGFLLLVVVAFVPPSGLDASCQGEECITCLAQSCQLAPSQGHCQCEDGELTGGGKFCIANGGICYIIP